MEEWDTGEFPTPLDVIVILLLSIIIGYYVVTYGKRCVMFLCTNFSIYWQNRNVRMDKKTVIITGAHKGIGYESAKLFAERGARVIIASRNRVRSALARDKIRRETSNKNVDFKYLNLASFACISNFTKNVLKSERRLHILIHTVVVKKRDYSLTADKVPTELQINHFGPFLLTMKLLPLLKKSKPGKIITVSPVLEDIDIGVYRRFLECPKQDIFKTTLYRIPQLVNLLFMHSLSDKWKPNEITANSFHPTVEDMNGDIPLFPSIFIRSDRQNAAVIFHLCTAEKKAKHSGQLIQEKDVVVYGFGEPVEDKLWAVAVEICHFDA